MKVLLSNDDGVDAPGLWALHKAISEFAEVVVVAPATERSAVGHGISVYNNVTLRRHVREEHSWGFGLDGTPADCVKMALSVVMRDDPPDLVISGINRGQNTGTSILYSGTVAAAMEATMAGLPAIAISQAVWLPPSTRTEKVRGAPTHTSDIVTALARTQTDYDAAAQFAARLTRQVAANGLPPGILLNVNVPMLPADEIRGVCISKMGKSVFVDNFCVVDECDDFTCYRNLGDRLIESPVGEDWDDLVLHRGEISVTPLHYDMTHHGMLDRLRQWALEEDSAAKVAEDSMAEPLGTGVRPEVFEP